MVLNQNVLKVCFNYVRFNIRYEKTRTKENFNYIVKTLFVFWIHTFFVSFYWNEDSVELIHKFSGFRKPYFADIYHSINRSSSLCCSDMSLVNIEWYTKLIEIPTRLLFNKRLYFHKNLYVGHCVSLYWDFVCTNYSTFFWIV